MAARKPKDDAGKTDPNQPEPLADGTVITDTQPLNVAPAPAADPAEGQLDAANDEQLNNDPQPVVAAGPDKGEERATVRNPQDSSPTSEKVRTSANSVWCPNDGISSPRGTDKCPACGFDFTKAK